MGHGEFWTHESADEVQEHGEPPPHESSDTLYEHGELWTHAPGNAPQCTPRGFTEMCCPTQDNTGITATSCGSGEKKEVQD